MKKIFRSGVLTAYLFLIMIFASASLAQMAPNDSAVPYKSIPPTVESTIERTAIIALRHISQARSDIHRKALASARRDLAEAERTMETIRDNLSTTTAKNLIRIARKHLEYEQPQKVLRDLPPTYSSLEMISVYFPTDKAMMHLDRAKDYLEKKSKREAEKELALADRSLIVIEVEPLLSNVQQYVKKAQGYLAVGKAGKADEALQLAEQRAMALYTGIDSPLFQAKRNIWLAFRNYSTARKTDVGSYLEQARVYLGKAAAGESAKWEEGAGELSQDVADLEKNLSGEGKDVAVTLKSIWEKSAALAERSAAYLSAGLPKEETILKEENNLVEARLHVAYAETHQVTLAEPDKAVKELAKAESCLKKAEQSRQANETAQQEIRKIEKALLAIKAKPDNSDTDVQERYEAINKELSDLIREL